MESKPSIRQAIVGVLRIENGHLMVGLPILHLFVSATVNATLMLQEYLLPKNLETL
jgi:hypothetical protein